MPDEFCPRCGQARIGMFRYCRSCGLDFDDVQVEPEPPESQPPAGWRTPTKRRPIGHYAAIGVAALVGLGIAGNLLGSASEAPQATAPVSSNAAVTSATPRATPTLPLSPTPTHDRVVAFAPTGPTVEARVVRVIDGDTIVVEFGGAEYHLRYIGMDTPESVKPVESMALAASAANEALIIGKIVHLEKDVSEVDQFDRLLRNVWVEREGSLVLVGLELVKGGFAQVTTYPPDVKYVDLLLAAEDEARTAGVGLWAEPASTTPAPPEPATPVPLVGGNCHPSYSKCLPIVDDLDCPDVRAMGKAPVTIKGPDDYRLDRDGDGLGCE